MKWAAKIRIVDGACANPIDELADGEAGRDQAVPKSAHSRYLYYLDMAEKYKEGLYSCFRGTWYFVEYDDGQDE